MRALATTLVLLAGCGKSTTPGGTVTVGDDDDDTEDRRHSAAPSGPKLAAEVRFMAYVAWDATRQEVVPPIIDGNDGYLSAYSIALYEEGWTADDETTYCRVFVDLQGLTLSPDAVPDGYLWGIDIPEGDKPGFTDCLEKGFDPSQWTDDDPLAHWVPIDWQLRLGGTKSQDLVEWLTPDTPTTGFDLAHFAAGAWSTQTGGFETETDSNFWWGYAMNEAHEVDLDHPLTEGEMASGPGQLVTGYFVFDQRVYWDLLETE